MVGRGCLSREGSRGAEEHNHPHDVGNRWYRSEYNQTQLCHQRKYLEGTYAARVRFTDDPVSGPRGDQLVQSFYTISPLKAPMDPDYSELDWEYLPNGGWGIDGPTLYATTWETFSPEPNWKKDNVFQTSAGSQAGWHTLITQVSDQKVKYFVDGKLFAEHGGNYYPKTRCRSTSISGSFAMGWSRRKSVASIRKTSIGCSSRPAAP
jgi:hypothetical protein